MPFPLQRLPGLALIEVFRKMPIFEILKLTKTSQKTRNLIKMFAKFPIEMTINHWEYANFITLHYADDEYEFTSISVFEGKKAWKFGESSRISIYEDPKLGLNPALSFLSEHFVVKSVIFAAERADSYDSFKTLKHVMDLKLKIEELTWSSASDLSMTGTILTAAIGASYFVFYSPPSNYQLFKFERFKEYSMERLKIVGADWISAQNLIDLKNCARVSLNLKFFSNQDFQSFCKHLSVNKNNVESWYISSKISKKEQFLDGLDWEKDGESSWRTQKANGDVLTVEASENGVSLQRRAVNISQDAGLQDQGTFEVSSFISGFI